MPYALIIDDEPGLSEHLSRALRDAGYVVDTAADGEQVDFAVQTEPYDAVVLDLGLPKIDGLEVLETKRLLVSGRRDFAVERQQSILRVFVEVIVPVTIRKREQWIVLGPADDDLLTLLRRPAHDGGATLAEQLRWIKQNWGFVADRFGIRPEPFVLGLLVVAGGTGLSAFLVRDTHTVTTPRPHLQIRSLVRDRRLKTCARTGLVNNANDAFAWALLPLLLTRAELSTSQIAAVAATYPIVCVAGSAGGLDAFNRFLAALPPRPECAFVVIQHLDPVHKSILPRLLAQVTSLPVAEAKQAVQTRPNRVYVLPPNRVITIRRGRLRLAPRPRAGLPRPIDEFLTALAREAGARVCHPRSGVVLDGSDGALRVMRVPFWLGLGGKVGSGAQYLPVISLADWVRARPADGAPP